MSAAQPGVLFVMGPTAAGKTELAIALAERLGAEIISADSRQVYRGMEIGTAQPDAAQRARVPHHLVGFLEPEERYSAARFVHDASAVLRAVTARGRRTIIVGGTGFYVRALTGEMALADVAYDEALRMRLRDEGRLHTQEFLRAWLEVLDAARARATAPADPYRTLRAIEVALVRGRRGGASHQAAGSDLAALPTLAALGIGSLKVALAVEREVLAQRVRQRARAMIAGGLLEEAQALAGRAVPAGDAVGYPQASAYLRGMMTRAELEEALTRATMRYAKRQMTWLRGEPALQWIPAGAGAAKALERAARETLGWT